MLRQAVQSSSLLSTRNHHLVPQHYSIQSRQLNVQSLIDLRFPLIVASLFELVGEHLRISFPMLPGQSRSKNILHQAREMLGFKSLQEGGDIRVRIAPKQSIISVIKLPGQQRLPHVTGQPERVVRPAREAPLRAEFDVVPLSNVDLLHYLA